MMHGFDDSISIDLAPLSVIYLKPVPKPKKKITAVEKSDDKKTNKVKAVGIDSKVDKNKK